MLGVAWHNSPIDSTRIPGDDQRPINPDNPDNPDNPANAGLVGSEVVYQGALFATTCRARLAGFDNAYSGGLGWRNRDKTWRNDDLRMLYTSLIQFLAKNGINPNFHVYLHESCRKDCVFQSL